jgi:hypothetical protein
MSCIVRISVCVVAVQLFSTFAIREAAAVQISLNLVQASSTLTITGAFGGGSSDNLQPQDGIAGTTDLNLGSPSNKTTFQGPITVDVDNILAPTSIQIISSAADADVSGIWLPQVQNNPDGNGDGDTTDFGLPPDGDSLPTQGTSPAPAANADWAIKVPSGFGPDIAFGAYRDVVYNISSGVKAVDGLGQFSLLNELFKPGGSLDYWVANGVPGGNVRGRTDAQTGGSSDYSNFSPLMSTYIVTPLGGGMSQITLSIPISVDDMGSDLRAKFNGQFVATLVIPEPTSIVLFGLTSFLLATFGRRQRWS